MDSVKHLGRLQLGYHLTFETVDLQDIIYTTLGDNLEANLISFFLYVPILIPDDQTQSLFNDSDKNSFTLSFDSWSTDRKSVDTLLQYQIDIGSAQIIISSKI